MDTAIAAIKTEPETKQSFRLPPDPESGALPGESLDSVPSDAPRYEHEHPAPAGTATLATKVRGSLCLATRGHPSLLMLHAC
jgi:hypothetical protein